MFRLLLFVVATLTLGCGSSAPLVSSGGAAAQVTADGDASDWRGALSAVEGEPVTVGVRSDESHVYVAVVTSDPDVIRHTLLTGMVVWLDAEGGKGKGFGVHFPLGAVRQGQPLDLADLRRDRETSGADRSDRMEQMTRELAIVQDDARTVLGRDAAPGLTTGVTLAGGTLTLELKVPLAQTQATPFAVGAAPGSRIGVGVETPELDREALREQMRAQIGQRGGRGGGARMGGRAGGGRAGEARQGGNRAGAGIPEPLMVWVRADLNG
jgi:hypothetical protein